MDDEENILRLLVRVLRLRQRDLGPTEVIIASNVPEALDHLERAPADVVLTDYRMPGPSGLDLIQEVRDRWPRTVTLLMTGYHDLPDPDEVERMRRLGIHEMLHKPWKTIEFLHVLRGALNRAGKHHGGPDVTTPSAAHRQQS